ncbi:DmsC/YnfH family molybdoenzyme membrane anchor subunit [Gordonibacter sp. 28C]|uniref:dimethyl sulfoxide reductase anchor subunit family protein n=1 Tax=Gordonibacter sp. 28C TaxID=2078569 RepID=UPI001F53F6DA|nr:DmsC/YnfH family molybdoenzyme membrane anchor subunit [Gordonibacter sp. 28C]
MDTALGEITLVLFTTLAPSGVVAFILMGLPLLRGDLPVETRRRIDQFLSIPLVTSMVGLVASATHLGNPANALYVFLGVGRSPLSTEVFCAVVFLALAGVYWLYSFSQRPRTGLQRAWMALAMVAGVVFVTSVAFAYSAETIVSWYTVYVPLNLWLNALVGGPLLAVVGLRVARYRPVEDRLGRALVAVSIAALAANLVSFGLQSAGLPRIENSLLSASDLVPYYGLMIAVFGVLALAGIGVDARVLYARRSGGALRLTVGRAAAASALALAGIFVMRFAFYMMHMTVGLGV